MKSRDGITAKWFDVNSVRVEISSAFAGLLDPMSICSEEQLVRLSGALRDSTLLVSPELRLENGKTQFEGIRLSVRHHAVLRMERIIFVTPDRGMVLRNAKMRVLAAHKGNRLGARMLAIQAQAATELEIPAIELAALGNLVEASHKFENDRWIGYWLWPQLGFDAPIPQHVLKKLPEEFAGRTMVSELIESKEGLEQWQLHGDSLEPARFDLAPDSASWKLLLRYMDAHHIQV